MIDGSVPGERTVDELVRLVDAVRDLRDDDAPPVETGHGDLLVRRDDDAVGGGNLRVREDVLHARRAVRLNLDGETALFRVLFDALRRHEGMCDARRAGGDGEDLDVVGFGGGGCGLLCGRRRDEPVVLLIVDEFAELFNRLCIDERFFEVRIHDHRRELREDRKMLVVRRIGRRDHEEQAARIAVHRGKIHAVRDGHRGKSRSAHARTLGVGGRDAVAEPRCAALLAREHVFDVLVFIAQIAAFFHVVREQVDGCLL